MERTVPEASAVTTLQRREGVGIKTAPLLQKVNPEEEYRTNKLNFWDSTRETLKQNLDFVLDGVEFTETLDIFTVMELLETGNDDLIKKMSAEHPEVAKYIQMPRENFLNAVYASIMEGQMKLSDGDFFSHAFRYMSTLTDYSLPAFETLGETENPGEFPETSVVIATAVAVYKTAVFGFALYGALKATTAIKTFVQAAGPDTTANAALALFGGDYIDRFAGTNGFALAVARSGFLPHIILDNLEMTSLSQRWLGSTPPTGYTNTALIHSLWDPMYELLAGSPASHYRSIRLFTTRERKEYAEKWGRFSLLSQMLSPAPYLIQPWISQTSEAKAGEEASWFRRFVPYMDRDMQTFAMYRFTTKLLITSTVSAALAGPLIGIPHITSAFLGALSFLPLYIAAKQIFWRAQKADEGRSRLWNTTASYIWGTVNAAAPFATLMLAFASHGFANFVGNLLYRPFYGADSLSTNPLFFAVQSEGGKNVALPESLQNVNVTSLSYGAALHPDVSAPICGFGATQSALDSVSLASVRVHLLVMTASVLVQAARRLHYRYSESKYVRDMGTNTDTRGYRSRLAILSTASILLEIVMFLQRGAVIVSAVENANFSLSGYIVTLISFFVGALKGSDIRAKVAAAFGGLMTTDWTSTFGGWLQTGWEWVVTDSKVSVLGAGAAGIGGLAVTATALPKIAEQFIAPAVTGTISAGATLVVGILELLQRFLSLTTLLYEIPIIPSLFFMSTFIRGILPQFLQGWFSSLGEYGDQIHAVNIGAGASFYGTLLLGAFATSLTIRHVLKHFFKTFARESEELEAIFVATGKTRNQKKAAIHKMSAMFTMLLGTTLFSYVGYTVLSARVRMAAGSKILEDCRSAVLEVPMG